MKNKRKDLKTRYKPSLIDSEYKYLIHNHFETNNFSGRPKRYKSEILHEVIKEQHKELITIWKSKDLKLRPLLGGPIWKPLTKYVKCDIKDIIKFLKRCKQNVTDSAVLVIFDACSLYTNIPHEFDYDQ